MSRSSEAITLPTVICQRRDAVVRLRLNRPRHYNALSTTVLQCLLEQLRDQRADDRVLVIEGGQGSFSIGSDIRELAAMTALEAERYSLLAHQVIEALESWPGMTVVMIKGYVIGSALELVLGCDMIVGSADVQIGMPGLAWALLPVMGGLRRLATRCDADLARRIFLAGDILDAQAAVDRHLLHRLIDDDASLEAIIAEALEWSPAAVLAIRDLRLRGFAVADARAEAGVFAAGFRNGECQRRLHDLLDS